MAALQYTNFAETTLASGISAVATSLTVSSGDGALFPSSGDFYIVITRISDGLREIVLGTARSSDVITIEREKEGTTGLVFVTGDYVELRVTAATLATYVGTATSSTWTGNNDFTGVTEFIGAAPIILQGATDNGTNKITVNVADPSAARAITIPDADVDLTKVRTATDALDGVVELATEAEVQTGTDTSRVPSVSTFRTGSLVLATMQTLTGTSIDFTGIPSWAKRITVMFQGLSSDGASPPIVQIGDSGGIETTGYLGSSCISVSGSGNYGGSPTTGFSFFGSGNAIHVIYGIMTLVLMDGATNLWAQTHATATNDTGRGESGGGTKALTGTLDRIRITMENGTDSFDGSGNVNIMYE